MYGEIGVLRTDEIRAAAPQADVDLEDLRPTPPQNMSSVFLNTSTLSLAEIHFAGCDIEPADLLTLTSLILPGWTAWIGGYRLFAINVWPIQPANDGGVRAITQNFCNKKLQFSQECPYPKLK